MSTPGPPWGEDSRADEVRIASNVVELLRQLALDASMGAVPADADELMAVLRLCARVHGEWVRIHP